MIKNILNKSKKEKKPREVGFFREYFELIAETLVYVFFVMTFLLQSFVIPTGSMIDNLLIGDHLLVNKVSYSRSINSIDSKIFPQIEIERGMIVTFKAPHEMDKEYVKRVIGMPGDILKIIKQQIYINGKPLDEPYKRHFEKGKYTIKNTDNMHLIFRDNFPLDDPYSLPPQFPPKFFLSLINTAQGKSFKVPKDHYFCLGDNRDNSFDSRYWGPVPKSYIIGKPWRIYWSFKSTTSEYLNPNIFHKIKDTFATIFNFFKKTRWDRTFKKIK
jgi:signal peptidase I